MTISLDSLKSWSGAISAALTASFGFYVSVQNQAIDARLKDLQAAEKRAEIAASFSERLGKEGGMLIDKNNPEKELLAISTMYALVADDSNPIFRSIIRRTVYKLGTTLGKVHLIELEADTCKYDKMRCQKEIDRRDALATLNDLDAKAKQRLAGAIGKLTDQAVISADKSRELSSLQSKVVRSIETIQAQQQSVAKQSGNGTIHGTIHLGNLDDAVEICSKKGYRPTPERVNGVAKSYKFDSDKQEEKYLMLTKQEGTDAGKSTDFKVALVRDTNVRAGLPSSPYNPKQLPEIVAVIGSRQVKIGIPVIRVSNRKYCSLWANIASPS